MLLHVLVSVFVFVNAALISGPRSLRAASTGCRGSQRLIRAGGELATPHGPSKLLWHFIASPFA